MWNAEWKRQNEPFCLSHRHSSGIGQVAERPKASDCKSDGLSLRGFKSLPAHLEMQKSECRSQNDGTENGRRKTIPLVLHSPFFILHLIAAAAGVAQLVEL